MENIEMPVRTQYKLLKGLIYKHKTTCFIIYETNTSILYFYLHVYGTQAILFTLVELKTQFKRFAIDKKKNIYEKVG